MGPDSPHGGEDEVSVLMTVLADEACRRTLRYFRSAERDVATLRELVDYALDHDDASADRERVAIELHHATLPKLADAGVLEYDPRNHDVRYEGHDLLESWDGPLPVEECD